MELSPKGKVEAQITGNKLRQYDPKAIWHSDFMRDSQTAHIIANCCNVASTEADYNARTWDTGEYSGQLEADVNPHIMQIYRNPWQSAPGGRESYNDFMDRWFKFLDGKLDLAANVDSYRPIIIVTHGRNIAAAESNYENRNIWDADMPIAGGYAFVNVHPDRSVHVDIQEPKEPLITDV